MRKLFQLTKKAVFVTTALLILQSSIIFADSTVVFEDYYTTELNKNPVYVSKQGEELIDWFEVMNGEFVIEDQGVSVNLYSYETEFGQKLDFKATKQGIEVKVFKVYIKNTKGNVFMYKYQDGACLDKGLASTRNYNKQDYLDIESVAFDFSSNQSSIDYLLAGETLEEFFNSDEEIIQVFEIKSPIE